MASRSIKDVLQDLTVEELEDLANQFQIGYPANINKSAIIERIFNSYNKFFKGKTKSEFENALLGEYMTRAFENMDIKEEKKAGARAKSPRRISLIRNKSPPRKTSPIRNKSPIQPMLTREKLKSMTVQDLKKYATDSLIYIPSKIKKDEIINTILNSYSKKSVESKALPTPKSPRISPRNKSPPASPRSELFSGGFLGVKNLIASLVSNYYLFTVKWKDADAKNHTEKYIVSVPEELNDYFSEKKSGYFDTKMFFGGILKEKFPEKFIQNKFQITSRLANYDEEGIEMSFDFYDFVPHLSIYNTYIIRRGEDIEDEDEENEKPSSRDINHAKRMIEYAKRGDYESFYKNFNKLNDRLVYYVISNIPMDRKFTRLFFIGSNPIIFRSRNQFVGVDPEEFEYTTKKSALEKKNFSPLTPDQLSDTISKELKDVKSGEIKEFESDVLKHALATTNKRLFGSYVEAIEFVYNGKINTFITQVLEQAVIQDDYELCVIILKRLLNNSDSKLVVEHMFDVAKSQKNERMINLFETIIKNPRNWETLI
jgi:hypothetical protein